MNTPGLVFLLMLGCGVFAIYLHDAFLAWRRWRGVRLVTCPETARPAAVTIDVRRAATSAFVQQSPDLRLASCSRWPSRGPCAQPCLRDLTRAGDGATVEAIASAWYSGRLCAFCGRQIGRARSRAHPAALVGADGVTTEWRSIRPEQLIDLFETHRAVCWDCHLAESFRRLNPHLYVDRFDATRRSH